MADDQQADFWYAETPDSNFLPAVVSMSIGNKYRWFVLKGIASKFNSRGQRWILRDTDEALRGPLHCGSAREVQKFITYLVAQELLFVCEDGARILTRRAFPHVREYPEYPDTEQSIRNIHALAANGSASYAATLGTPPPSARQALGRAWNEHVERMAAQDRPVPQEKADKRGYAEAREAFAARFVPWYMAQKDAAGPSGRVAVQSYVDAEWRVEPAKGEIVTEGRVTSGECHTSEMRDKSQSHSHTETHVETPSISKEMSFQIHKRTTDRQSEDVTGRSGSECHKTANSLCDNFYDSKTAENAPDIFGEEESVLTDAVVAAVDILCEHGVKPREAALAFVLSEDADLCLRYGQAMPAFIRQERKKGKPIRKTGPWLLAAIKGRYEFPAVVQSYVDGRQKRLDAQAATKAKGPDTEVSERLGHLDRAFGALSEAQQREIDTQALDTLPDYERKRLRRWLEDARPGDIPITLQSRLTAHRRAAMLKMQEGGT